MGKNLLYVGAGGFVGTLCRYGLNEVIPLPASGFPAAILFINLAGCLFLGWFLTTCLRSKKISDEIRLLIGTGFTGAFTTFSTFTVDTLRILGNAQAVLAGLYVMASIVGGIMMTIIGVWLGRKMGSGQEGETS